MSYKVDKKRIFGPAVSKVFLVSQEENYKTRPFRRTAGPPHKRFSAFRVAVSRRLPWQRTSHAQSPTFEKGRQQYTKQGTGFCQSNFNKRLYTIIHRHFSAMPGSSQSKGQGPSGRTDAEYCKALQTAQYTWEQQQILLRGLSVEANRLGALASPSDMEVWIFQERRKEVEEALQFLKFQASS